MASFRRVSRWPDSVLGIKRVHLHARACRIDRIAKVLHRQDAIVSLCLELDRLRKKLKIATEWLPRPFFSGLDRVGEDRDLVDELRVLYHFFVLNGKPDSRPQSVEEEQDRARKTNILWRTLVFNRTFDGDPAPESWAEDFSVLINGPSVLLPSAASSSQVQPKSAPETSNQYKEAVARATQRIQPLLQTIRNLRIGKRFVFQTDSGRIGVANHSAKVGDSICVILGCSMPMVASVTPIKRSEQLEGGSTKAILCGAAYVHEYMYGLAVDEIDAGQRQLEWFEFS